MKKPVVWITLAILILTAAGVYYYDHLHLSVTDPFRVVSHSLQRPPQDPDYLVFDYVYVNASAYPVVAQHATLFLPGENIGWGSGQAMSIIPPGGLWRGSIDLPSEILTEGADLRVEVYWQCIGFPPVDKLRSLWFRHNPDAETNFYYLRLVGRQDFFDITLPIPPASSP